MREHEDRQRGMIGMVAALCLAAVAVISGPPYFSSASRSVRGITNPVLAMEVVQNVAEVDAILSDAPSPDREAMRLKQYADFGFIACYAALFVLMAMLLGGMAWLAAALGLLAAACDVAENLATLRLIDLPLSQTTQARIDGIRDPALMKWALASLALGMFAALLLRQKTAGLRIVGVCDLAAAALGLYGLVNNAFLAWSGLPMLAGILTLAILFFRPRGRYRGRS